MKVLLLTNKVPHYRIPLYNMLGQYCQLSIAHTGERAVSDNFQQIILKEKQVGPFFLYRGPVEVNDFQVIIVYLNVRLLNMIKLLFRKNRKYKVVLYGIGVSASYSRYYDRNKFVGWLTKKMIDRSDASVFYDHYPVIKYCSLGVNPNKLFVAPNTVLGNHTRATSERVLGSVLFVGTLYRAKGVQELLEAYDIGLSSGLGLPRLNLIGDGPDRESIRKWIVQRGYEDKIQLCGRITEGEVLAKYFSEAFCCVSPGQAGLSVLTSFSHGVPFITSRYPITGGEFTAVIDGVTGLLYNGSVDDLLNKINEIVQHPNPMVMRENCRIFYEKFRSPTVWLSGMCRAIEFAGTQGRV